MKDTELANEPASNRNDTEHEIDIDQITDHSILEPEERHKFNGVNSIAQIWIDHMHAYSLVLNERETHRGVEIFAKLAVESGYGFDIDAPSGTIYLTADNQDEYDDALQSAAIQLCDSESGYGNAREALRRIFDS